MTSMIYATYYHQLAKFKAYSFHTIGQLGRSKNMRYVLQAIKFTEHFAEMNARSLKLGFRRFLTRNFISFD